VAARPKKKRVVIRIDGHALLIDDLTLAEFRTIEEKTGVPWTRVNPLASAEQASAVLYVVLRRGGSSAEQAQARVDGMSLTQTLKHLVLEDYEHDDDRPAEYENGAPVIDPKADTAAQGTTTSS
jgi:hypothetical protein